MEANSDSNARGPAQNAADEWSHLVAQPVPLPGRENENKFAVIIDDVFTLDECQALIKMSEEGGYVKALLNVGGGREVLAMDVRNSGRWMTDDVAMADKFFQRVRRFIPPEFDGRRLVSLNERLRFLRYHPGQSFRVHMDGSYVRPDGLRKGEQSCITLQVYLNEVEQGGATTFFDSSGRRSFQCECKPGRVLLFQHDILHEGSPVLSGVKYVIRTDVMYSPRVNTPHYHQYAEALQAAQSLV